MGLDCRPFNVVLIEPEIPANTGNISRTCAATGARLHLIRPLGFEIDDKHLKRAGLDYWRLLDVSEYDNIEDFFGRNKDACLYFLSTKAPRCYSEMNYPEGAYFVFGKETRGLDESLLREYSERCVRIPMIDEARSLNLSNSVAIVLYEALRQNGFRRLLNYGKMRRINDVGE